MFSAKSVVHSGCTTGLQAELAGIPAIEMSGLFSNKRKLGISADISRYKPKSIKELSQTFKSIFSSLPTNQQISSASPFFDECFSDLLKYNVKTINPTVLSKMSSVHGLSVPKVSNSSMLLSDFFEFTSSTTAHVEAPYLTLEQVDKYLGSSPPLASKSSLLSAQDIYSRSRSLCRALRANIQVIQFGYKNVFLISPK